MLALALALPAAQAIVVPRFGGAGKHVPHETPPPAAHELPTGARVSAGEGPFRAPPRAPEPEWIRAAHEQATSAAQEAPESRFREQAESAGRQATGGGEKYIEPWPHLPHLRVRVTGRPELDLPRLRRLADRLAQPIDPERLRSSSLADDVSADSLLDAQRPGGASRPERVWARTLRGLSQADLRDPARLAAAMQPMKGELLMLMAHVDDRHGEVVFRGADGQPRRVKVDLLESAAETTGVQLLLVGCQSGRLARAGFADNLNSLDAARAMLRAHGLRPTNAFELLGALSGPDMTMLIDPEAFLALHQVAVHANGPQGPYRTTIRWRGSGAETSAAAPAPGPGDDPQQRARALAALQVLGGATGLSFLASVLRRWDRQTGWQARAKDLGKVAAAHVVLPTLWLSAFAEAVGGANDLAWRFGGAGVALAGGAALAVHGWRAQVDRLGPLLGWLRWTVLALPFMAVGVLEPGLWSTPPLLVSEALRSLYALGRWLPEPLVVAGLAIFAYMAWGVVLLAALLLWLLVSSPWRGWRAWQARRARRARLSAQLAEVGVVATSSTLRAHARLLADLPAGQRWDGLACIARVVAPDPWAGADAVRWQVLRLPLGPPAAGAEGPAAWGLMRHGSAFLHPLPWAVVQRWQAQQVQTDELPALLHRVEPNLRRGDFLPPGPGRRPPLAMPLLGLVLGGLLAWLASLLPPQDRVWAGLLFAAVLGGLVLWPWLRWGRRRLHQGWLLRQRAGVAAA